jgi:hypothetical protein
MKSLAYWDRVLIKDIVNTAFEEHIARHEKKRTEKLSKMPISNVNLNHLEF